MSYRDYSAREGDPTFEDFVDDDLEWSEGSSPFFTESADAIDSINENGVKFEAVDVYLDGRDNEALASSLKAKFPDHMVEHVGGVVRIRGEAHSRDEAIEKLGEVMHGLEDYRTQVSSWAWNIHFKAWSEDN